MTSPGEEQDHAKRVLGGYERTQGFFLAARGGTCVLAALAGAPMACGSEPSATPPAFDAAACAEYVAAHETAAQCTRADIVPPGKWQVEVPAAQLRTRELFEERCRTWLGAPGSGITPAALHTCSVHIERLCIDYNAAGVFAWSERFTGPAGHRALPCDFDIPGTLPDDAACGDSTQCAGGLCKKGYAAACGTCVSRSRSGELCGLYGCTKGTVCDSTLCGKQRCPDARCLPAAPRAGEGEACAITYQCPAGLVCDLATTRTCTLPGRPGAACGFMDHDFCRFGLCEDGACAGQRGEGGRCSSDAGCSPGLSCARSACVKTMAPALAAPGQACDPRARPPQCRGGECKSGTCVPFVRVGEPCDGSLSCEGSPFVECLEGKCQLFDPGECR